MLVRGPLLQFLREEDGEACEDELRVERYLQGELVWFAYCEIILPRRFTVRAASTKRTLARGAMSRLDTLHLWPAAPPSPARSRAAFSI